MTDPITVLVSHARHPVLAYIVGLVAVGVVGIVLLFAIRPDDDTSILISLVTVFVGSGIGHILTYAKSQETHAIVNSRMDEFKAALEKTAREAARLAYAEGQASGRALQSDESDRRGDR